MRAELTTDFDTFRREARRLASADIAPSEVFWSSGDQGDLFALPCHGRPARGAATTGETPVTRANITVPKEFVEMAARVICHRDDDRCSLLYRVLWRLTHGEKHLLNIAIDDDVRRLTEMERGVRRDRHKMTAFVRFRKIETEDGEHFLAWHRPDHYIVRLVSNFFVDRFRSMKWTILTPDESMSWDGSTLQFGPGVASDPFAGKDDVESLWMTYYANIFNPARIKLDAMRNEMPKKHWATMPETALIPQMLAQAPKRVATMIREGRSAPTAASLVPVARSLPVLREAARTCTACPICTNATQTVFGVGPERSRIMIVGEQPGDEEDRAGIPFVGPAGRLFSQVLNEIGQERDAIYITNAVKHFKFEPRGVRRIHSKPNAREIVACRPWLEAEIETIRPERLILMGNTAAQSLIGHHIRITKDRGEWMETKWCPQTILTFHPSAILRALPGQQQDEMRELFKSDLKKAFAEFRGHSEPPAVG